MTEETGWKQRMSRRFYVDFTAYLNTGKERIDGVITQISEGGAIFVTDAKLPIRTAGLLHINVFEGESAVVIDGEIIYSLHNVHKNDACRYGVRFSCADKEMKEALSRVFVFVSLRDRYQSRHGSGSDDIR